MQFNSVNDFLVHVQEELDNNRLILPTLPDIAIKVRSIVNKVGAPFLLHETLGCPIATSSFAEVPSLKIRETERSEVMIFSPQ
jgi:hypothetical protein